MKEHKYRGKRVTDGEWMYGSLFQREVVEFGQRHQEAYIIVDGYLHWNDTEGEWFIGGPEQVHPETVGEYTGKKDTEGVEIYEGHICTANWPCAEMLVVTWDKKRCGFYMGHSLCEDKPRWECGAASYDKYYKMNANKMTVIGDIYTNPEILNKLKE